MTPRITTTGRDWITPRHLTAAQSDRAYAWARTTERWSTRVTLALAGLLLASAVPPTVAWIVGGASAQVQK